MNNCGWTQKSEHTLREKTAELVTFNLCTNGALNMRTFFMRSLVTLALLSSSIYALGQDGLSLDAPPPSGAVRRTLAKQLASQFTALDRQIPTLSPSQERWLKVEYIDEIAAAGNRYTNRSLAAADSLEYQIFIVKPRNAAIVEAFTRIATGNVRDKNHEIALWSSAASWFVDYEYWQAIRRLVERGTVQKKIGYVDDLYFENYTLEARALLQKIVIPYLEGRSP